MDETILDLMFASLYERLESSLLKDEEYILAQKELGRIMKQLDSIGLSKEQKSAIDQLFLAHSTNNEIYTKMAYKSGFKDFASLLKELYP